MRLVLLGAPGSGKGTQGALLAQRLGVPLVSTGELLRAHAARGTDLGRQVAGYLNRGDLVPDDLILAVVGDALSDAAMTAGGYVLDGFPRTVAQAHFTDALAPPEAVIHLALPDEVARRRLAQRTGDDRSDDTRADVVERRLGHFHAETEPLLEFYRQRGTLRTVDGNQPPEAVSAAILEALD
ncbi:MAG: nucleoside monophosphate kinase [Actinomycetota bacterium]|nr:nucleoside monophosphate kinase [Actinomycetota bacterium]